MSSFAAYLEVSGNRYSLHRYELSMYQETDALGRPSSPVLGGKIDCTLAVTASQDSFLDQWMLSPTLQKDGLIRLLDPLTATTFKTVNFFNAYCTGMDLHFLPGQTGGAGSTLLHVQISPQRIAVGAIVHDNNWPVESHGSGESHEKQAFVLTSEDVHTALDAAGYVPLPLVGTVTGIADTALYLAEGDLGGAALAAGGALLGVLPFGRLAGKGLAKGIRWAGKTTWGKRLLQNITGLGALVKRSKVKPNKTPSQLATKWQGKGDYPGVDKFRDVTVKKGKIIYVGEPGGSGFFFTEKSLRKGAGQADDLWGGLQVKKDPTHGYRKKVGIYEVTDDAPGAFGTVNANPNYGPGGLQQLYIPDQSKMKKIGEIDLQ